MQYDILDPSVLRAAITVLPGSREIRYYLQGLYINYQTGRVVACDGHRLLVSPLFEPGADDTPPQILKFIGKNPSIPKGADRVVLDTDSKTMTAYKRADILAVYHYEILAGTYPDYERVTQGYKPEGAAVLDYGVDAEYLADVQKALGANGCKLSPRGDAGQIVKVDFSQGEAHLGLEYYIMPMKI
jgi:hypothetical protein